jgi:hypothetical protein
VDNSTLRGLACRTLSSSPCLRLRQYLKQDPPALLASAASFLYPILKYLIPPKLPDLGNDAVLAAKVSELKPNTAKIFHFGTRPGILIEKRLSRYTAR